MLDPLGFPCSSRMMFFAIPCQTPTYPKMSVRVIIRSLSVYLSVCLSLSVCLCLSVGVWLSVSVYLSVCLSVCLRLCTVALDFCLHVELGFGSILHFNGSNVACFCYSFVTFSVNMCILRRAWRADALGVPFGPHFNRFWKLFGHQKGIKTATKIHKKIGLFFDTIFNTFCMVFGCPNRCQTAPRKPKMQYVSARLAEQIFHAMGRSQTLIFAIPSTRKRCFYNATRSTF